MSVKIKASEITSDMIGRRVVVETGQGKLTGVLEEFDDCLSKIGMASYMMLTISELHHLLVVHKDTEIEISGQEFYVIYFESEGLLYIVNVSTVNPAPCTGLSYMKVEADNAREAYVKAVKELYGVE